MSENNGTKGIIYFLSHDKEIPEIITYENIASEEHFMNMIAMGIVVGNKDGTFNNKVFGYYNKTWYHASDNESKKVMNYREIASKIEEVLLESNVNNEESYVILSMMANRIMQDFEKLSRNIPDNLPAHIVDGVCQITDGITHMNVICNLGYACDGCPYNKFDYED